MIFLIEYDRVAAKRVFFQRFEEAAHENANRARLARELYVRQQELDHEVVLLEAPSEAALMKTHSRYFDDLERMIDRLESSTSSFVIRETAD